jgi:hypothetical protein
MKYFPYLLILILSYFVCVQYNEIKTLYSKINALDYKTDNIKKKEFPTVETEYKETFYLTQLSNSTTLILSVIGFALVFAGISSYILIKERFEIFDAQTKQKVDNVSSEIKSFRVSNNNTINTFRNEISVKLTKYEAKYKEIEHIIYDLKNELNSEVSELKYKQSKKNYDEKNFFGFIFYGLLSLKYNVDVYSYNLKNNNIDLLPLNLNIINSTIDVLISDILKFYTSFGKETLNKEQNSTVINLLEIINSVKSNEVFDKTNKLYNLLEFKD